MTTTMDGNRDCALLALWEHGQALSAIDRALMLCAWARPELDREQLSRLPLGAVNAALLQLRGAWCDSVIELELACEQCGESLETRMATGELLADARSDDGPATVEVQGFVFRLPDSRDLAAITHEPDIDVAARQLLQRCCTGRPEHTGIALHALLTEAGTRLESADPLADLRLDVACHACGHHTPAALDPGSVLWTDVQRQARLLLEQVHTLARAYGWSEGEVLSLGEARRAAYLDLASA